jgi:hypothetical protein
VGNCNDVGKESLYTDEMRTDLSRRVGSGLQNICASYKGCIIDKWFNIGINREPEVLNTPSI